MSEELILSVKQMKLCESYADSEGVNYLQLMENAGKALAERVGEICTEHGLRSVLILTGKGNNGGDGIVCAHHLRKSGIRADIMLCCGMPVTDISKEVFSEYGEETKLVECENTDYATLFEGYDMLLDCVFGTGFKGGFRENILPIFKAAEVFNGFKTACDIPSGVNADSGEACDHAFRADETITMHAVKTGMLLSKGRYLCGRVTVCEIGIPDEAVMCDSPEMETVLCEPNESYLRSLLPKRQPWAHKGSFGKLICVCGSDSYVGAAGISVTAALRTGVGLVELCSTERVVNAVSSSVYECIYSVMKTDPQGFMTSQNAEAILKKAEGASAMLIGCGLGHTEETEKLVAALVENSPVPVILDADGINSLVPNIDILAKKKSKVILTPHPAELARLCSVPTAQVLSERFELGQAFAKKYDVVLVSKSSETMVFFGDKARLLRYGDTSLAKGGSGDMLAGIIGSLTAQQPENCEDAAQLGCCIMGRAAETLSGSRLQKSTASSGIIAELPKLPVVSQRGILASDVIASLPAVLRQIEYEG